MKFSRIFLFSILFTWMLSLSSCSIAGEKICGTWHVDSDGVTMKVEITPWEGKFHGYLLNYDDGTTSIVGAKEEEYIFLTDLVFQDDKYEGGKIYIDQKEENACDISIVLVDDNHLKASYTCGKDTFEETWVRDGFQSTMKKKEIVIANTEKEEPTNTDSQEKEEKTDSPAPKEDESDPTNTSSEKDWGQKLTTHSGFYVIGIAQTVSYTDVEAMTKAVEGLWTKAYNDDFSNKLKYVVEVDRMYLVYSAYDKPKGKMTLTLGYKVKSISGIPNGLTGVSVPENDYLKYTLSGDASDYEGEGWDQLEELMMYRKDNTVDFEVYTFDSDYEVTNAEMWIGTK